jgi:hypothetical protein
MAGVGAPWAAMGELAREGRDGEWEGEREVGHHGEGLLWRSSGAAPLCSCVLCLLLRAVREEEEESEKKKKRKEKKRRKNEKNSKLENF